MDDESRQSSPELIASAISRILERSSLATLATLIQPQSSAGAKLLVDEDGIRTGSLGDRELDHAAALYSKTFLESKIEARTLELKEISQDLESGNARILFERIEPEPRLVICGAGHVGAALAQLAAFVGYRTTLIDDRAEFVTRARFPDESIELIAAENWADSLKESVGNGRSVAVAVVTRGHNEDEECMRAVIQTGAAYIGLIGSKRRTNIVLERLRESGMAEERLRAVRAPIGLDIRAVSPQEVALSILAEIVAERRGGTGSSLSKWRRETSS